MGLFAAYSAGGDVQFELILKKSLSENSLHPRVRLDDGTCLTGGMWGRNYTEPGVWQGTEPAA